MNPYEERARARKAYDLQRALEGHLPAGTKPSAVLAVARQLAPERWAEVAQLAGLRVPSADTVAVAIAVLEARAAAEDCDPWEGLQ